MLGLVSKIAIVLCIPFIQQVYFTIIFEFWLLQLLFVSIKSVNHKDPPFLLYKILSIGG